MTSHFFCRFETMAMAMAMAMAMPSWMNPIVARYTDVYDEPVTRVLAPIKGYQDLPLVSLEKALEPICHFFNGILENAWVAKENCQRPQEDLTQDESASIHLYTMQFDGGPSLFYVLNRTLRAENRQELKPWFSFLKLFLTALYKLPSRGSTVWRGVRDVDLSSKYPKGAKIVWWGVSSCTTNVEVLKNNQFLGTTGLRTIFSIECQHGKSISRHSYFQNTEEEVILIPGSYFEVIGQLNPAAGLHIIQLKEIDAPFALVKPPFKKSADLILKTKVIPWKKKNPPVPSLILPSDGKNICTVLDKTLINRYYSSGDSVGK
ncbi:unnamed protein product [Rotaria sp. Silwood2]|nr:unnamed protein product [Rotaria sp. Silwood2]CAF3172975.1 unnamed protein product [Rotaria sp. Silwood2]CAF4507702.1 unnamed protein product [Rotaria sp. Silwood2]CAF4533982.1 unnamed protein product [Rotaria sp. Silwood2]